MKILIMSRFDSSDQGTFSSLKCEDLSLYATERPWLNNKPQVSCIPAGRYEVRWHRSPKFGMCYKVQNVPGRGDILFHAGNFYTHSHGCILPATKLGYIDGKKAGLISKPAVSKMNSFFNTEPFILEIRDDYLSHSIPA
jgi:hypothetical protein